MKKISINSSKESFTPNYYIVKLQTVKYGFTQYRVCAFMSNACKAVEQVLGAENAPRSCLLGVDLVTIKNELIKNIPIINGYPEE